ncbi:MAG: hypothetical protein P4L43_00770 [Syntrophobacteraceae bacterium]|nr:hypothetical protein [Syntrophobacteraceae bacterium]
MPGAQDIAWKVLKKIKTIKASRLSPRVGDRPPDQDLGKKEKGHDEEKFDRRPLRVASLPGDHLRVGYGEFAFPSEKIVAPEREQNKGRAAQKHYDAQHAPKNRLACRRISHQPIVGEIAGVGIGAAGPNSYACPGRPGKEGR